MDVGASQPGDIRNVCRICLLNNDPAKYIHEKVVNEESVFSIIKNYTTLQIEDSDQLPKHICSQCELQVIEFCKFRLKYERSRAYLEEYVRGLQKLALFKNGTQENGAKDKPKTAKPQPVNGEQNGENENIYEEIVDIYGDLDDEEAAESNEENLTLELPDCDDKQKRDDHFRCKVNEYRENNDGGEGKCDENGLFRDGNDANLRSDRNTHKRDKVKHDNIKHDKIKRDSNKGDINKRDRNKVKENLSEGKSTVGLKKDADRRVSSKRTENLGETSGNKAKTSKKTSDKASKTIKIKKDGKVLYMCRICGQTFDDVLEFSEHRIKFNHATQRNVTCTLCDKPIAIQHYKRHINAHMSKYTCPICAKKFFSQQNLNRHKLIHKTKTTSTVVAELLGLCKSFKQKEKKFTCATCHKSYTSEIALCDHKIVHTDSRLTCHICKNPFSTLEKLKAHMIIHQEKLSQCYVCGKKFSSKTALKLHLAIHAGIKPFKCTECGQKFSQNGSLLQHMLIHQKLRPYQCQSCLKTFNKLSNLRRHELTHMDYKPFICEICDKRFAVKYALLVHRRVHTGEAPFQCPVCARRFVDSGARSRHIKVHL